MAENANLADFGIGEVTNTAIQDALACYVKDRFEEARKNKRNTGVEDRLLRNLRANCCEYQPDEKALLGPYNDVYIGIAALKARAAESWLNDIILNNIDKPWTLSPTPVPDLPDELREHVIDSLLRELPMMGGVEALLDRARQLKALANNIASDEAAKANTRMESLISDQMAEGKWTDEFGRFVGNLCVYPSAFVRGPVVISKPQAHWDGNTYKVKSKPLPVTRVIDPFDAFPAPNSTTCQNGDGFTERARFTFADIHAFVGLEGFNESNVRTVLEKYPNGFSLNLFGDAERDRLEQTDQDQLTPKRHIDTLVFNGKVPGHLLAENGVIVEDPQKYYECEVWVAGDYTIRAVLNPDPLGTRPVDCTSYRKVEGKLWGQSVIDLVYDTMRVCNAAARALVRNMSYSSGPIGEVVSERLADGQDPTHVEPYKIALVGPDLSGTGAPAYKFHNVQSVSPDLLNVFNQYMKIADDLSGVPAYVLGNPQVAGAGRTMGGLAMLMGNAAKGIKNVQLNIDRDIIAPLVTRYYHYNMLTSDDTSIKADAKVVARGATGLLQRELAQTRTVELLQLLTPYIENWEQLPDGIKVLLREVLKPTGLDVDKIIPDPEAGQETQDIMRALSGGNMGQAMNRGTSQPVPLPPQSVPQLPQPLSQQPAVINMPTGA